MIGVLFDFFNTIVDVDVDTPRKWEILNNLGYSSSLELQLIWDPEGFDGSETPSMSDKPNYLEWRNSNIRQLAIQAGVPENKLGEIVPYIIATERSFTVKAKNGAIDLIRNLKRLQIPVGICSNWDDDIDTYLIQSGLPDFDAVITSSSVGARKPHVKPFLTSCDAMGLIPDNTLFVGDSWKNDVVGAIRSGLIPVWLTHTEHNPLPQLVHAIPSLDRVMDLLTAIHGRRASK